MNRNTNAAVVAPGGAAALLLAFLACGDNRMLTGGLMSWWG